MYDLTTQEWLVLALMMVFMAVMSIIEDKEIRRK